MMVPAMKKGGVILLFLCLWETLPLSGLIDPLFLPRFSEVILTILELCRSGELLRHTRISLIRAFTALLAAVIIGMPLGVILGGWFPRLQQATEPLMELFSAANPVILAHIIIFFLGIGESAKTFIIAWLCIWPIIFSTVTGIRTVDVSLLKAAGSLGLGPWRLFILVVLPSAAPTLFTGLRLAAGYAFIMLIAAEMMGGGSGLGWFVLQSQENYHVLRVFAGATVITFLAVLTDVPLKLLQNRWTFKEPGCGYPAKVFEPRNTRNVRVKLTI
jgi:NitT/TauT family transport system permease protein